MHENYIRDGTVVEAFEIIMRQMITPRDATTPHYSSCKGENRLRMNRKTWRHLNNSGIYIHPFTSNCCFHTKAWNSSGVLNSGLMKKSLASSYLLVCGRTPSVETNISFVRHMFLRQDPSKSCSINFTVCFTDLPFPPCVIFLIESRF